MIRWNMTYFNWSFRTSLSLKQLVLDRPHVLGDTDSHNPVGVHFFACSCVPLYLWCLWSRVYVCPGGGGNNVMSLAWSRVPLYLWCVWSRVYVCPGGGGNNVMSLAWSRAASCLWCLWSRVYVGHGYMWVTRICVYRYIDA